MTAEWDDLDRYVVISADTHCGASLQGYRDYLAPKWRDEFDAWSATWVQPWTNLDENISRQEVARNWDSDLRQKELEAQGIAGEVLFPNTTPPFFETIGPIATVPSTPEEYDRRWAGLQAHNRWLVDFCNALPGRRKALVQVYPHDIDEAMKEITWAAGTGVFGGIIMTAVPPNSPAMPLYHRRYDPVWSLCEETGLSVNQHAGSGTPFFPPDEPATGPISIYETMLWCHRTSWHLLLGGVFERHPKLKFVSTEQAAPSWYVRLLEALDGMYMGFKGSKSMASFDPSEAVQHLPLKPSEYAARNCYVGASIMPPFEVEAARTLGIDRIMWGSDYPHEEGTVPYTFEALRAVFADCGVEETRTMLGGVAADVYGFDKELLAKVAQEIGPTLTEVHTPLDVYPADATSMVFAPAGMSMVY